MRRRPRILLIVLEFPTWHQARHQSYAAGLGWDEGLRANGVDCVTITTPWLPRAREIAGGKRFDQVWIEVVHHDLGATFLDWVAGLAPVRVAILGESLTYRPEECEVFPVLRRRKDEVARRLEFMTHVLTIDEKDAEAIFARARTRAMWSPCAVTGWRLAKGAEEAVRYGAVFAGAVYGPRAAWLEHPELSGLLLRVKSPEGRTIYPNLFDHLHRVTRRLVRRRSSLPGPEAMAWGYLRVLRELRRRCYAQWLRTLQSGSAVVSLPSFVKGYPGRVVEAMAAGRPVVSWEIPDRPLNRSLFEDGMEILLYSTPEELASQIRRVLRKPDFGRKIAERARHKVRELHTVERRVREVLRWIESSGAPYYA